MDGWLIHGLDVVAVLKSVLASIPSLLVALSILLDAIGLGDIVGCYWTICWADQGH